ncbi:tyrosine-type recombinase/integrase [Photobacterium sp. DA100]|uniref:phage integrase n=1 Tax=Photobacterium sp. DA100 TaxID=3027472 RepID=UPI00247A77B1|nr:tyrosine-type recombinase/integrase [Photobacterium sp. DA100]WEM43485.1 tyrosine-type recombinase/integrase [Photobacterium sp. DA100]
MSVRKQRDGTWLCECYPHGRQGKRVRKKFATKGEATAFERFTLREAEDKPWLGTADDKRRLSDLIELWYHYHGKNIKTGKLYLKILNNMCGQMGNPIAAKCKAKDYTEYRANRTNILMGDGRSVAAETQNLELTLLKAVFNELIRIKEWPLPNPFAEVKKIRSDERELTFLSHEEIRTLLDYVGTQNNAEDMTNVIKVCLATGSRIMEAAKLKGSQLTKYKITFTNTKGKRNRTVPISPELYDAIHKPGNGPLFSVNYFPVYMRLRKCFPELPKGQATHVLRHTFASHFMMNGGNILVLQRILGHRDIKQTMVYSHFSPDHLQDAVTKNPLNYL